MSISVLVSGLIREQGTQAMFSGISGTKYHPPSKNKKALVPLFQKAKKSTYLHFPEAEKSIPPFFCKKCLPSLLKPSPGSQ